MFAAVIFGQQHKRTVSALVQDKTLRTCRSGRWGSDTQAFQIETPTVWDQGSSEQHSSCAAQVHEKEQSSANLRTGRVVHGIKTSQSCWKNSRGKKRRKTETNVSCGSLLLTLCLPLLRATRGQTGPYQHHQQSSASTQPHMNSWELHISENTHPRLQQHTHCTNCRSVCAVRVLLHSADSWNSAAILPLCVCVCGGG